MPSAGAPASVEPRRASAVGRQFSGTFGTNVAIAALGFVTGSISARVLGPSGRGELAAIQTIPGLLGWVAVLGVPNAVAYYVARTPDQRRDVFSTGLALSAALSALGVLAGVLLVPWILGSQTAATRASARLYLVLIPLLALQHPAVMGLWAMQRFRVWNALRIAPSLCWLAALLVVVGRGAPTAAAAALLYASLTALLVPLAAAAFLAATRGSLRFRWSIGRRLLAYGVPTALANVPSTLNYRLDQALMAAMLPASTLGLYAVSVSWSGALAPLTSAFASVLFPRLAAGGGKAAADDLGKGLRLTVLVAALGTCGVALLTPLAMPLLFGAPFRAATPAALVLVVAAAFAALNGDLEESLRGLGGTRWPLLGQLAGLPVTVSLLAFLLRPLGLYGAAIASLFAYLTTSCVLVAGASRMTGRSPRTLLVPTREEVRRISASLRGAADFLRPTARGRGE